MAQCKQTAHEFIQNAFSPMIAVQCSQDAESICLKNNLTFVELVQPFCRLTTEGHIRDPSSMLHVIRNMRIIIKDISIQPPQPTVARKILNEVVANTQPSSMHINRGNVLTVGDYNLQLNNSELLEIDLSLNHNASTPWFEAYRETFLQVAYPFDHEFLRHFIACIFVVSSSHSNPVEHFNKMNSEQQALPQSKMPKWFSPVIFKYYVLLHDVSIGDEAKAEAVYQNMKSVFGAQCCHLLQINSRALHVAEHNLVRNEEIKANLPDPWSQFLNKIVDPSGFLMDNGDEENTIQSPSEDFGSPFPKTIIEGMDTDLSMTNSVEVSFPTQIPEEAQEAMESPIIQENTDVISHPLQPDFGSPTSPVDPFKNDNEILPESNNSPLASSDWSGERNRNLSHGMCLTVSDIDRIRIFIQEFCIRGLLPFVEGQLRVLNDQVTTQKGLRRTFLSATKKFFGSNKPAGQGPKAPTNTVVYSHDSSELQIRRLGDLSFMFQLFELAYQSYHTAKRDFNNDQAWLYYAGALEMACLSVFMQGHNSQRPYPHHYMETAVSTYLNTCKMLHLATRAVLFSTEALKYHGFWYDAAVQFTKMTNEESDLRSALLLEQAAHCYYNMPNPMVRKYAFQMILAGHRFSKAGQRKHTLRCYRQALQVYKGKGWSLAEDHINFTIGRQSFSLKQLENATIAFKHLLTRHSKQIASQQGAYLREYLFVYKELLPQSDSDENVSNNVLPQLPLPYIDNNMTKVLLGNYQPNPLKSDGRISATGVTFSDEESDNNKWFYLEGLAVAACNNGNVPHTHKPTVQCFTNKTNNSSDPFAVVGEPITVELLLKNPLKIQLVLTDASLLWRFIPVRYENGDVIKYDPITNEKERVKLSQFDDILHTCEVAEIIINESESKHVHLCLIPHKTGELHITGLAYNLGTQSSLSIPNAVPLLPSQTNPNSVGSIFVRGKQSLEVQGPRCNNTKSEKYSNTPLYSPDRRLDPVIVPKMPLLEVNFSNFPTTLLCEEIYLVDVEFVNRGNCPLTRLLVASTHPELFSFGSAIPSNNSGFGSMYQTLKATSCSDWNELLCKSHNISQVCEVPMPGGGLSPESVVRLPLWIRGANVNGSHEMDFLFFYLSKEANPRLRYRILRHKAVVNVSNSLSLNMVIQRGVTGGRQSVIAPEHLVITLEIENLNQIHDSNITELDIIQVSCASKKWSLRPFASVINKEPVKIKPRETACLCFKALRCKYSRQDPDDDDTIVVTNVTFQHTQINSAVSPCIDFYYRSQMKFPKAFEEGKPMLSRGTPVESKADDLLNEKLQQALKVGLTLIVLWKAFVVDDTGQNHAILGQHHVSVDYVDNMSSTQSSKRLFQNPLEALKDKKPDLMVLSQLVHCCMQHKETVEHNFSLTRFCLLPVTLVLYNCCDIQLKVVIDTSKISDSNQTSSLLNYSSIYQIPYTGTFTWVSCNITSLDIAAHSSQAVTLTACFSKPGVYNVSSICVAAAYHAEILTHNPTFIPQKPMAPSLVVITKSLITKSEK